MKTLALDLSTKSTGWAIYEDTTLLTYGLFTAYSTDVVNRIQKITKEIQTLVESYPEIKQVLMEEVLPQNDQFGVGNLHTHKVLMWLQASIIFMLHEKNMDIKIEYLYPSEWRAACGIQTGRGVKRNKLKQSDIDFVKKHFHIDTNDDTADAIALGYAFLNKLDNKIEWE